MLHTHTMSSNDDIGLVSTYTSIYEIYPADVIKIDLYRF